MKENYEIITEKDEHGNVVKATIKMLDEKKKKTTKSED